MGGMSKQADLTTTAKWTRTDDGFALGTRALVHDNGGGFGPSKGSGRWAVIVDGKWVANIDKLVDAKAIAAREATS